MIRHLGLWAGIVAMLGMALFAGGRSTASPQPATQIVGNYLETRTCDVYTGPCFANAQVGVTGQQAILAWNIEQGSHRGIALDGLNVVVVVRAADTLGFGGGMEVHPDPIKSVILLDERGSAQQREALEAFAREHAPRLIGEVTRVAATAINLEVDHIDMVGKLQAGKEAHLLTRKLAKGDCVCSNEVIYYPPLTEVENSAPAYTVEGGFGGRGLKQHWSNPRTRSSYLATFAY